MTGVPRKYNETFDSCDPLAWHVVWSWFTTRWPRPSPTNAFVVFDRDGKCFTATEFEIGDVKIKYDPNPPRWDLKLRCTFNGETSSNRCMVLCHGVLVMAVLMDSDCMSWYLDELDARHAMLAWCGVVRKRDGFDGAVNSRVASFLF